MNKTWQLLLILTIFLAPAVATAANVSEVETFHLVKIPGFNGLDTTEGLFNGLYTFAIAIAAILVTIRLIYAGVQYMFSEVITSKGKAKEDIKNALLGLLIILGAVTILNTVNPQLTKTNVFDNLMGTKQPPPPISKATSPVAEDPTVCGSDKIWMECATPDGADYQCKAPGDTGWCTGTLTAGDDLNPNDASNPGTWVATIDGNDSEGNSPAMQISTLSQQCRDENGRPEYGNISDDSVRFVCHK